MSLKVVFDNRENKPVHECNVCSKVDVWSDKWEAIGFGIGVGYKGEDGTFITCSSECRKKDKEEKIFEKYRRKLHDHWWEINLEFVDKSEKKFKNVLDDGFKL